MNVLPPLNRPISTNGPLLRVPRQPVEQRRLVDLQRRDAVVELVRREEERQILEPAHVRRPCSTFGKRIVDGIAQHGRVDQVLPDAGAAQPPNELLDAGRHGGERYCNART